MEGTTMTETSARPFSRRGLLFYFALLACFVIFFDLGGREPETKDYIKHAEVAREIRELGDWNLLHLGGRIYVDKPPLHFWLMAGAYRVLGVGPAAARMPEALAALASVLLVFFVGERFFSSAETGFLAGLFLLSSYAFYIYARRMRLDLEFSLFFGLALLSFHFGLKAPDRNRKALWYLAFWFSTGLAGMVKAFVALAVLPVVIPIVLGLLGREDRKDAAPLLLAATSPALFVPVIPWALGLLSHPQFEDYVQVLRRVTIMTRHGGWFYYLVEFPTKFMPATPFLALGVWAFLRHRGALAGRKELAFLLLWIGVFLLVLHFTSVKNHRYLLPVFMPSSLVAAWAASFYQARRPGRWASIMGPADRIIFWITAASFLFPLAVALYFQGAVTRALLLSFTAAAAFLLARRNLPMRTAGVFVSVLFLLLNIELGDGIRDDKTGRYRALCLALRARGLEPAQVGFQGCDARARYFAAFFYDRLPPCAERLEDLLSDPHLKAVVAGEEALKRALGQRGAPGGRVVTFRKRLAVFFREPGPQAGNAGPGSPSSGPG
ncbi:MAG: hypothetical protein DRH20_05275 [Deltaproteobacteria bacterium]|nr:MAG: hypothetical protein DRH20_05275 [Deltaproteobacteria bacterium]